MLNRVRRVCSISSSATAHLQPCTTLEDILKTQGVEEQGQIAENNGTTSDGDDVLAVKVTELMLTVVRHWMMAAMSGESQ